MTGHPLTRPRDPLLKLFNQSYQRDLVHEIWSQWGNFSPGGPGCCRAAGVVLWTLECLRSSILVRPSTLPHRTGDYLEGEPWFP